MTTPGRQDIPRLPHGVKVRFDVVRGEHFLLAPERAFALDQAAHAVLELVDGARSFDDIIDVLAARFSEKREVIANDVFAMLDDLSSKRVIEL
jgi:pyrroloquinoline quinone biosynthesis protein D